MATRNILKKFHPVQVDGLKRLGNKFDGGYIVHAPSLKDTVCLMNYGVGYNVEFEKDYAQLTGMPVLAFDPTLSSISPILAKLAKGELIPFLRHAKNYIAWKFEARRLAAHHIKWIAEGISDMDSVDYKTLGYHLRKYNLTNEKIILKIDVEGAEYPVFKDPGIYPLLRNVIQIILEFHHLSKNMAQLADILDRLSATHSVIHLHANNHSPVFHYLGRDIPEDIEITFLSNEYLVQKVPSARAYPVPGLDQPCHKRKPDIVLDFFY